MKQEKPIDKFFNKLAIFMIPIGIGVTLGKIAELEPEWFIKAQERYQNDPTLLSIVNYVKNLYEKYDLYNIPVYNILSFESIPAISSYLNYAITYYVPFLILVVLIKYIFRKIFPKKRNFKLSEELQEYVKLLLKTEVEKRVQFELDKQEILFDKRVKEAVHTELLRIKSRSSKTIVQS